MRTIVESVKMLISPQVYKCRAFKPRGQQQGKIASKILEILKILRVVYDKNR